MGSLPEAGGHCPGCGFTSGCLGGLRVLRVGGSERLLRPDEPLVLNAGGLSAAGLATRAEVDRNWGELRHYAQMGWCVQPSVRGRNELEMDGTVPSGAELPARVRWGIRLVLKGPSFIELRFEKGG